MQITDTILMVRPAGFSYNKQTAVNNFFQQHTTEPVHEKALQEFDAMVSVLRDKDIHVIVAEDSAEPAKPDAVFPNNWFSTHRDGSLHIFPMFAPNRRDEKRDEILQLVACHFKIDNVHDWTEYEAQNMFLEGTGSMVMDHKLRIVYACLSPRTHPSLVKKFAAMIDYQSITFTAADAQGHMVYHTNVMLAIGDGFAVLCADAINDDTERLAVIQLLAATGRSVIPITISQMQSFAGNLLQVKNKMGEAFIIISQAAHDVLEEYQRAELERFGTLLPISVPTIEKVNGGSVRCMMAEIFLKPVAAASAS